MRYAVVIAAALGCSSQSVGPPFPGCQVYGAPAIVRTGGVACIQDADCNSFCGSIATELRGPIPPPPAFDSALCAGSSYIPNQCLCGVGSKYETISPGPDACQAYGRGLECIYPAADFPGCTRGSTDCIPVCDDLHLREVASASHSYDAQVRGTVCEMGYCACVLSVDSVCHVWNDPQVFDCALSPREMIARCGGR